MVVVVIVSCFRRRLRARGLIRRIRERLLLLLVVSGLRRHLGGQSSGAAVGWEAVDGYCGFLVEMGVFLGPCDCEFFEDVSGLAGIAIVAIFCPWNAARWPGDVESDAQLFISLLQRIPTVTISQSVLLFSKRACLPQ